MANVILWLLAVEAVGLAAFPLAYYLLPSLRDRGFSVSKLLGLLLVGYLSWVLSVLHVVPSVQLTLLAILALVAGLAWWYGWRHRDELLELWKRERTTLLVGEAVFLVVFLGWVAYRAYDPAIDHTEQPMDYAFLNASVRSTVGFPEDPWLRGEAVSYYYFGYWMMGVLSELTGIASNISYNLSLALIPAAGGMAIFGLVSNLVRSDANRLRYALIGGVAAAVLLIVGTNLEGLFEFARANGMGSEGFWRWASIQGMEEPPDNLTDGWTPGEFWWWWRASRVISTVQGDQVIDYTIEEFPFFSFMLGDLHPHVMSIPFLLLFLAFCWNYLRSPADRWNSLSRTRILSVLALGLSLGGLAFTNMWDLPVFAAVFLGVAVLKSYGDSGGRVVDVFRGALPVWAAVVGVALLLILPYLLTFTSQVEGIAPVTATTTRPLHLFIVWGIFLVAVTPFILTEFWQTTVEEDWSRLLWLSLAVGFIPYLAWVFLHAGLGEGTAGELVGRLFHVLPFALLVSVAVYTALWLARRRPDSRGKVFALSLSALGLLLMMGPELLHVNDSFGGASERMNTVFKLYYQAWIVLATASGFALYYWSSLRERVGGMARVMTGVWSVVFVALFAASAYYPAAAAATKGNLFHDGATLDGLAYLSRSEYGAIRSLRKEAGPDSAVLEAVGGDYSSFGRVSGSTGVPTVLGWPGHELQWRGSSDPFEGREEDVAAIYQTEDVEHAKSLLAKYDVDYVYVGPRERDRYGVDGLAKFDSFMEPVFRERGVVLYRSRP